MFRENPLLSDKRLLKEKQELALTTAMTYRGTLLKICWCLGVTAISASLTWHALSEGYQGIIGGVIAMFPLVFIALIAIAFRPHWSRYVAMPYAAFEGALLSGVTFAFERMIPGIGLRALTATSIIFVAVLYVSYSNEETISITWRNRLYSVLSGVVLFMIIESIASFFVRGEGPIQMLRNSSSIYGIAFSVFMIVLGTFILLADIDSIKRGSRAGLPDYMEWYCAISVLATLFWLYAEILRLIAKTASKNRRK